MYCNVICRFSEFVDNKLILYAINIVSFYIIRNYLNNASGLYELLNIKYLTRNACFVYPLTIRLVSAIIFLICKIYLY